MRPSTWAIDALKQHVVSISDENDDEITRNRFDLEADNADLAIRTCRCGTRIDGFDEYISHLQEVLT